MKYAQSAVPREHGKLREGRAVDSCSRTNTLEAAIHLHHRGKAGIPPVLSAQTKGAGHVGCIWRHFQAFVRGWWQRHPDLLESFLS